MKLFVRVTCLVVMMLIWSGQSGAIADSPPQNLPQPPTTSSASQPPTQPSGAPTPAHPFLLFNAPEASALAARKEADPLLQTCWQQLVDRAQRPDDLQDWTEQLEARAFLWQVNRDPAMATQAIRLVEAALDQTDPVAYYQHTEFHYQAAPLRALALAWDWLYQDLSPEQRTKILPGLERWCQAAFEYTNRQWWREASYNVGAIPVAGIGLLATAIRSDSTHPMAPTWYREAVRRMGENFFPTSWKPSGICWEGPNYAIVGLRYAVVFADALRRAGGPDLLRTSGATQAMQYLMYQWLPQGGCAPIGDNTSYGRRTFAAEYLLGLQRSKDAAGLWTWRTYTDADRLDPLITYLWYPLDLTPRSPVQADLPTSRYFEVTPNRAGYVFSRTAWDDANAAFFAFVTRFEKSNHQHYDMMSFLLGGFGTLFATHELLFPYGHEHHGVDFEHNLVIVDEGGWPAHDKSNSCGDDNSTDGVLVGMALGPFADYVRGDGKWSYRDNTILNSNPAIRAERACLFVKDSPAPYLLVVDDLQYSDDEHRYDWLWYAPDLPITGTGTADDPLVLAGAGGTCAIHFLLPAQPAVTINPAPVLQRRRAATLKRIAVTQQAVRSRYVALATLQPDAAHRPTIHTQPVQCDNPSAAALRLQAPDGTTDWIAWQSEEERVQTGSPLHAGPLQTDALLAMVRLHGDRIAGYVLGEGTYLRCGNTSLVQSEGSVCVTAGPKGVQIFGRLRTREALPSVEPTGVQAARPQALLVADRPN